MLTRDLVAGSARGFEGGGSHLGLLELPNLVHELLQVVDAWQLDWLRVAVWSTVTGFVLQDVGTAEYHDWDIVDLRLHRPKHTIVRTQSRPHTWRGVDSTRLTWRLPEGSYPWERILLSAASIALIFRVDSLDMNAPLGHELVEEILLLQVLWDLALVDVVVSVIASVAYIHFLLVI